MCNTFNDKYPIRARSKYEQQYHFPRYSGRRLTARCGAHVLYRYMPEAWYGKSDAYGLINILAGCLTTTTPWQYYSLVNTHTRTTIYVLFPVNSPVCDCCCCCYCYYEVKYSDGRATLWRRARSLVGRCHRRLRRHVEYRAHV